MTLRRMAMPADELPDDVLAGFSALKAHNGRYPDVVYIAPPLALMYDMKPGVWVAHGNGIWRWDGDLITRAHVDRINKK